MFNKLRAQFSYIAIAIVLGLAMHVALRVWLQQGELPALQAPNSLFELQLKDANGQPFAMKSLQNKTIVLNFWATWCEPCREEMPEFSELAIQYANSNIAFVGLAIDEASAVATFSQTTPVKYPLLIAENEGMVLAEQLGNSKGVLPYTVIIGADGAIKKTFFGRVNRAMLEPIISSVISESHSTSGKK